MIFIKVYIQIHEFRIRIRTKCFKSGPTHLQKLNEVIGCTVDAIIILYINS
jgi:hypothetical protein